MCGASQTCQECQNEFTEGFFDEYDDDEFYCETCWKEAYPDDTYVGLLDGLMRTPAANLADRFGGKVLTCAPCTLAMPRFNRRTPPLNVGTKQPVAPMVPAKVCARAKHGALSHSARLFLVRVCVVVCRVPNGL